jgi:hypothetical protein
MKRTILLIVALASCMGFGCTHRYTRGVSETLCEIWIYTLPQGARLYLNNHYVGRTPYKYTGINKGDSSAHFVVRDLSEIMVRKRGYDDEVKVVTLANCYRELNIENEGVREQVKRYRGSITLYMDEKEQEAKEEYGNIVIEAVPSDSDAEIYINDSLIGNGKTSLLKLPAGSYVLKVRKPGCKTYSRIISVLPDNDITVQAILEKLPPGEEEELEEGEAMGVELSPAEEEVEIEEDTVPGTLGGKE